MEAKYKVGDLVTISDKYKVWYTYLDYSRKPFIGKVGRIVEVETQEFTAEDLEWFNIKVKDKSYVETIFNYKVVFPEFPEREIFFTEVHLEPFKLRE